uniref:DekiORF68 n=1 Tax=Dendrolimus kikuchii nucleopolyhedrovirus TaxID=1219875 RepID=V9LSN2_9ABAC|nr:DekiORF68 [Dendrolimus kikuchii nucleopolyhedrovirus]
MALVPAGVSSRRLTNHCIFASVVPFDACITYKSPCSSDASVDDGWFICDYHLRLRFKIAKMVLPIFDEDDNQFKRTIGRHLVGNKDERRVLVPTAETYQNVFNLPSMMQSEQLIIHLIYNNAARVNEICEALKGNENYFDNTYSIIENVYSSTSNILALTDPNAYCSRVSRDDERYFDITNADALGRLEGDIQFRRFSGFLQNLIRRAVAPEIMQIDGTELRFRNCATCRIDATGLVATVPDGGAELYNPVSSRDIVKYNNRPNRLQVRSVLKFEGDTRVLDRALSRYEEYPMYVPLFLGLQLVNAENNLLRANNFIPSARQTVPTIFATAPPGPANVAGAAAGV